MNHKYRWLSLLLVLAFVLALTGCGSQPQEEVSEEPTLHIALNGDAPGESLEGLFSPFYARTIDDHTIVDLTQLQLLPSDRAGKMCIRDRQCCCCPPCSLWWGPDGSAW